MKIMKKNRRLLFLFTLITILFQSQAYSQIVCIDNLVAALQPAGSGTSSVTIWASDIIENDGEIEDGQISLDNVAYSDFITFDCDDLGTHVIYAQGTDQNGVQTCWGNLTIEDKLKPVPYAQNITVSLNGGNSITISPSAVDAGSFDNCSIESVSLSQTTFTSNGAYIVCN